MLLEAEREIEIGLAAGTDDTRPVLTHVMLRVDPKPKTAKEPWTGQIDATDSYMAVRAPVELQRDLDKVAPGVYLIHADGFRGKSVTERRLEERELVVRKRDGSELRFPLRTTGELGAFPNFDKLWPTDDTTWDVCFNAAFLAKLARAMGTEVVRIRFSMKNGEPAAKRPMVCYPKSHHSYGARAIFMPVDLSKEGEPDVDA